MISIASCWIEKQAGYSERAFGIFQGLLELNLNCPEKIQSDIPIEMVLDYLQTFWESEAPRIGEPEALGWNQWQNQMQMEVTEKRKNIVPDYDPEIPTTTEKEDFIEENSLDEAKSLPDTGENNTILDLEKPVQENLPDAEPDSSLIKNVDEPNLATQMDEIKQNLKQWLEQEENASNHYWLPTRDILEEDSDPERIVFF